MSPLETLETLAPYFPKGEFKVISFCLKGEESKFFADKVAEIAKIVSEMPVTYGQDDNDNDNDKDDEAIAYLHYFKGSWDWYITERDSAGNADGSGQHQCFGLVFGFDVELGYISLPELIDAGVELDLHFTPTTLDVIEAQKSA